LRLNLLNGGRHILRRNGIGDTTDVFEHSVGICFLEDGVEIARSGGGEHGLGGGGRFTGSRRGTCAIVWRRSDCVRLGRGRRPNRWNQEFSGGKAEAHADGEDKEGNGDFHEETVTLWRLSDLEKG
jgi:hypothetical protein